MFHPLFSTRLSQVTDANDLTDIDVKAFEIAWSAEEWYELVRGQQKTEEPKTVVVLCYYGTAIGFAVVRKTGDEALIDKIAIKETWREQGASKHLLQDVIERAQDTRCTSIALIMPESFVYPVEGELSTAMKWAMKMGFKAVTPFKKKYFTGYGTTEDGVKFVAPINNETPTN